MHYNFKDFSQAVQNQFNILQKNTLYKVDVDSDLLYQTYLDAYPEGTNEIYRVRPYYDCSADRHFIKNLGKVVSIIDDKMVSVWDNLELDYPYDIVAQKMAEFVGKQRIQSVYLSKFAKYGTEFILELLEDKTTKRWDNFVGVLDRKHLSGNATSALSSLQSDFQVLKRGLDELSVSSLETVQDLIKGKLLYRGEEHAALVKSFSKLKKEYDAFKQNDKDLFIWQNLGTGGLARFRNTVIGTLVQDLSNGIDLEDAVKMFESKVAPQNYKRPQSLITPKMIEEAMDTIKELELESALERRHAKLSDISVEDVLFVDNCVRGQMIGGLEGELLKTVKPKAVNVKNTVDISVEEFISAVLPKAHEIEALVTNKTTTNLASLTAPVNENVKSLFKWDNNFAWSYSGNVADSDIKQRVKKAGGEVDSLLRCSLAWNNTDDLDIHCLCPDGDIVSYSNKRGILDIDMNAGGEKSRNAVENLRWNEKNIQDGVYTIKVKNFTKRESIDVGFALEVESGGMVHTFVYDKPVPDSVKIDCIELYVKNKTLVDIKVLDQAITSSSMSKDMWGIKTETFVPVSSVVLSPNYWGKNKNGNKHWFFILKDCNNPEPTRGIYNEFLNPELDKHRKVFEIVGEKTKCPPTEEQLSGLGFSSTKKECLTLRVKSDKMNQTYNVNF